MKPVSVRNLERIEEHGRREGPRVGTLFLASLGGGAMVLTALMTMQRQQPLTEQGSDALDQLVARAAKEEAHPPSRIEQQDLTFPEVLADEERPTTALAAVKDERGRLIEARPGPPPGEPPPAGDTLPVVPLPAGSLLNATDVTKEPTGPLTQLAAEKSDVDESAPLAEAGSEGGYQIQVASFQKQGEADEFVRDLRKRGHRAYRQAAYVANRGLWHRVRIGPFKTKYSAGRYKKDFEEKERMSTFLVDPEKVKRQKEVRDAKLAVRMKKYGAP